LPGLAWTMIHLFILPAHTGMTGTYHQAQLLVEICLTNFFA
jgi:hypothetical protein